MLKAVIDNETFFEVVKAELKSNKQVQFTVKGQSMWPFFHHNKTVVTIDVPLNLKKYDVVLFEYHDQVLLHRIIKMKQDTITLRGDATYRKEVVNRDAIFGKVIAHQNEKTVLALRKSYRFKVWCWVHNPFRKLCIKVRSK